jgi:hypothetical protein
MFDAGDPLLARLRDLCRSFPHTAEKVSHGRPVFFTGKVFAVYGGGEKRVHRQPGDSAHIPHDRALIFRGRVIPQHRTGEAGRETRRVLLTPVPRTPASPDRRASPGSLSSRSVGAPVCGFS